MRVSNFRDFLTEIDPDIVLLQEIKCETDKFPYEELSNFNYNFYIHGQKSYNGVAILSKFPADEIITSFPANPCVDQARFIEASIRTPVGYFNIISIYAPNGFEVGSDKFTTKLEFYKKLIEYLQNKKSSDEKLIIGGDFNIAPFDIDVHSPIELTGQTCFTLEERQLFRKILNSGYHDLYRMIYPDQDEFSWWDYRAGAFEKNKGMRIDMILASDNIADLVDDCHMLTSARGKTKPSDHIPVIASLKS